MLAVECLVHRLQVQGFVGVKEEAILHISTHSATHSQMPCQITETQTRRRLMTTTTGPQSYGGVSECS